MEFSVQVASPVLFAERFVLVMGLKVAVERQVLFITKLLCKYMAHKSEIYLQHRPSVIGAVSVVLALNISSSQKITEALKFDLLFKMRESAGVLGAWTPAVESVTRIKCSELHPIYAQLISQVDKDVLLGVLATDLTIWL